MRSLDGVLYARMINSGAASLRAHVEEVNDLNVFPIPDGDTGDNMLLTVMGGVSNDVSCERLGEVAERVAADMLLSARGNSGVILSQFFEGIKRGFAGLNEADTAELGNAFRKGVAQAYGSVVTPTEGTILTVIREATEYACASDAESPEDYLSAFIDEAKRSLERTPELLPVLKRAGVVDSGAAGLIYIVDGMLKAALGIEPETVTDITKQAGEVDVSFFTEDSVLEFGYCTELLVRLQNCKTDIAGFDEEAVSDFLKSVGDSVVIVRNGSILKLHVHTFTPHKVLEYCQTFGEFLKVKIENMSLQHNEVIETEKHEKHDFYKVERNNEVRKNFGIVAVVSGEGLQETFLEMGADVIVDGGQCSNPSAEEMLEAIERVNADTVFLLPNNGNVILTAKQAAALCKDCDVRVVESHTVGEGYAALSMYDVSSDDADEILEGLNFAMEGVVTAEVSKCVRDTNGSGDMTALHKGEYIGFVGKELIAVSDDRAQVLPQLAEKLNAGRYEICLLIVGKDASMQEAEAFRDLFTDTYAKELYLIEGGQEVYDYIMILE